MSSAIRFNVQGIPRTKGSTRSFQHPRTGKIVTMNDNKREKPWSGAVSLIAQCHAPSDAPWTGPVELNMSFYLPKPKSFPKNRNVFHTKKPDLDKLTRSVTDALSGVFFVDDKQVVGGYRRKLYGDKPGVDIEVINLETLEEYDGEIKE